LNIYQLNKFLYQNQNWFGIWNKNLKNLVYIYFGVFDKYKSIKIHVLMGTDQNPCNCLLQWLKKCESKDLNSTCDYKMLENNCKNLQMNSFKSKELF
ncbi:hypothetical protein BpHYR1_007400, partial [Brachionus plicatilis]